MATSTLQLPGPDNAKMAWPPPVWSPIARAQNLWSAWYSGDPDQLSWAYQGLGGNSLTGSTFFGTTGEYPSTGAHFRGPAPTATATIDRYFWGQITPPAEKRAKLHIPLAGDIASMSADLLFSKRPRLEVPDKVSQAWLENTLDDELHATLREGAEVGAALGGRFMRIVWDKDVADQPWVDIVHPDAAVPTFRHNKLISVVFWRILEDTGSQVVRHLEQHDMIGDVIQHGVYVGDQLTLGMPDSLANYPQLAPISAAVDPSGNIVLPDLPNGADTVTYIPNMRPNRAWRYVSGSAPIGRSDYQGVEPAMDALDETYTSWMRDIRLGKMRLMVPTSYLESRGPGKPAIADIDREVFIPMNQLAGTADKAMITANQFQIRFQEHANSADRWTQAAVQGAGYSPQTFGEQSTGGGTITATEIEDRQRRTLLTRGKKIQYERPGTANVLFGLMAIHATQFGQRGLIPQRPDVVFPNAVLPSPQELAQTAVALSTAKAASLQTLVQMVNPDWDGDQVDEEVDRIKDEQAFDVLGRARMTLAPPMGSTENLGQQIDDIESTIKVDPAAMSSDPQDTGAALAT